MAMTIETLHPDIKEDNEQMGRELIAVIDPSPGIYGEEPIPGLVSLVYACEDEHMRGGQLHEHQALYGPKDEKDPASGYTCYAD